MDRRTKICVWVIVGGLVNFLLVTIVWFAIGGDAQNGKVVKEMPEGKIRYYVQLRAEAPLQEVGNGWFYYSAIHGWSIWITCAAVMLAMLTLAKDRLTTALSEDHGRALIHIFATVVVLASIIFTVIFVMDFEYKVTHPELVDRRGEEWNPTTQMDKSSERRASSCGL
jgi:hypothetical protein